MAVLGADVAPAARTDLKPEREERPSIPPAVPPPHCAHRLAAAQGRGRGGGEGPGRGLRWQPRVAWPERPSGVQFPGGSAWRPALPGGGGGTGVALHCLPPEMLSRRHLGSQGRVWSSGGLWAGAGLGVSPRGLTLPRTEEGKRWLQAAPVFCWHVHSFLDHMCVRACVPPWTPPSGCHALGSMQFSLVRRR